MEIGVALPTMAKGYNRSATVDWSVGIDAGPFSSVSCGERITYHNAEMMVTLGAAAALTERVRVFVNLVVAPMHPPALVAKQLATLQVLSEGRVTLGVGVGGREHDYKALGVPFDHRHARLDTAVEELGALLRGEAPFEGADPVGPPVGPPLVQSVQSAPVQSASDTASALERSVLPGISVLVGAMGPKGLDRAARWSDGVSGFSLTADGAEIAEAAKAARRAWSMAGRDTEPRVISGCFYVLGGQEPAETLRRFTYDYLEIFGQDVAQLFSESAPVWNAERLRQVLDDAAAADVDEFILVPGTVDLGCLEATTEVVTTWLASR
jgi:alkanesulfonate monooxygenase SsuD/methylene tetrahydromethanopterin reductase-like flavin-dependent oxidoreductase (luciferase family)